MDCPDEYVPPGGWRRIVWNYCWRRGLEHPFPHPPTLLDEIRSGLRALLTERKAPAWKIEALTEWGASEYVKHRRFEENRPGYDQLVKRLGRPPLRPRPYLLVAELPQLMREPAGRRGQHRDLIQFANDWAVQPADRRKMMAGPPPPAEAAIANSIATVVHALCDLDEIAPPEWVFGYRSPTNELVWGMQAPWFSLDRNVIDHSPPACAYHRIYFTYDLITGPLWINPPAELASQTTLNDGDLNPSTSSII